jgi:hypothetical protein
LTVLLVLAGCGSQAEQPESTRVETVEVPSEPTATEAPEEPTVEVVETTGEASLPLHSGESGGGVLDEIDCQLQKATAGMSRQEATNYGVQVVEEAMERGTTAEKILAERGFTC